MTWTAVTHLLCCML